VLLQWRSPDSTANWFVRVGVTKCKITDKDFGLIPLDELEIDFSCFNFTTPQEIGRVNKYLLRTAGFDYVVQLISDDGFYRSQLKMILQKR
jgi:hypothetical protein